MLMRLKQLRNRSEITVLPPPGGPMAPSMNISCRRACHSNCFKLKYVKTLLPSQRFAIVSVCRTRSHSPSIASVILAVVGSRMYLLLAYSDHRGTQSFSSRRTVRTHLWFVSRRDFQSYFVRYSMLSTNILIEDFHIYTYTQYIIKYSNL